MAPALDGLLASVIDPSHVNLGMACLLLVALAIPCTLVYRLFLHPLAGFPGPFEARVSGLWRERRLWRGTWHEDILQVHERFGSIVRIAPNELSVVDEHATKLLYGHGSKSVKARWYGTWDIGNAEGIFSTRSKESHSFLRRRVSPAYSMTSMLQYEKYIQPCLDLMMSRFKYHADLGHTVDMSQWVSWLAFDVVGTLAYGQSFGQLDTESDAMDLAKTIHQGFFMASNAGNWFLQAPTLMTIMSTLRIPHPFAKFEAWTMQIIRDRRMNEGKNERRDMLQHFLEMKSAGSGLATDREVMGEAGNIIGAGADTTSIAMATCLYYLCKDHAVYQQVQKEIDEYHEAHDLKEPMTYKQTQDLPLMSAAIKEAMRLLPSITYQLPRVMSEEMLVAGRTIPAGTIIGVSALAANRNQAVWGADANEFKPSRWLESEEKSRYLSANDMTFGGNGSRMCIGRNLALVEVHKFVAQLLRNFDVSFENDQKPWKIHSQWFALQSDMHMKITSRQSKAAES